MILRGKKRSIGDAAKELGVDSHVIRFWQKHFEEIQPEVGKGQRRYYYDEHIDVLKKIKDGLYNKGYTIQGLRKAFDSESNSASDEQNTSDMFGKDHDSAIEIAQYRDSILSIKQKVFSVETALQNLTSQIDNF